EATGAYAAVARALWRAWASSQIASQSIAGDPGGDDWHNAAPGQFFHEQIQKTGLHPIQRRDSSPRFPPQCCPARVSSVSSRCAESHWIDLLEESLGSPFRLTHSRNMAH